jgi:hypothetical protein
MVLFYFCVIHFFTRIANPGRQPNATTGIAFLPDKAMGKENALKVYVPRGR